MSLPLHQQRIDRGQHEAMYHAENVDYRRRARTWLATFRSRHPRKGTREAWARRLLDEAPAEVAGFVYRREHDWHLAGSKKQAGEPARGVVVDANHSQVSLRRDHVGRLFVEAYKVPDAGAAEITLGRSILRETNGLGLIQVGLEKALAIQIAEFNSIMVAHNDLAASFTCQT